MLIKTTYLLKKIIEFNGRERPRAKANRKKKSCTYESINALHEGKELGSKS